MSTEIVATTEPAVKIAPKPLTTLRDGEICVNAGASSRAELSSKANADSFIDSLAESSAMPAETTPRGSINYPANLASLSLELQIMILQELDPASLYSAMNTWSVWRNAVQEYPKTIIKEVMARTICPKAEQDFILALHVQKLRPLETNDRRYRAACRDMFREFEEGRMGSLVDAIKDGISPVEILNLYCHFEYFIVMLTQEAVKQLPYVDQSWVSWTGKQPHFHHTTFERTRLQRAFFRHEVISFLMQTYRTSIPNKRTAVAKYIARFRQWELEEIVCVNQFFYWAVLETLNKVDDHFVNRITQKTCHFFFNGLLHGSHAPNTSRMTDRANWSNIMSNLNLHLFSVVEQRQDVYTAKMHWFLTSRGVLALWKLTHYPLSMTTEILQMAYAEETTSFNMPKLLNTVFYRNNPSLPRTPGIPPYHNYVQEDVDYPNFGWLWALPCLSKFPRVHDARNYTLRNIGYVFWDKCRFMQYQFAHSDRVFGDNKDKDIPPAFLSQRGTGHQPSVFERLYNFPISEEIIRACFQEMGFTGAFTGRRKWMNFGPSPNDHTLLRWVTGQGLRFEV